jgi:plasmid stabilization system protein ParE
MSYKMILRQEAERDLVEAYKWYEEKVPGLGADFLAVIERALESIQENPARFPVIYRNVHRALMRRFPYGIFYFLEGESIIVLGVMHTARNPEKWRKP